MGEGICSKACRACETERQYIARRIAEGMQTGPGEVERKGVVRRLAYGMRVKPELRP